MSINYTELLLRAVFFNNDTFLFNLTHKLIILNSQKGSYLENMSRLRVNQVFILKANNIPINTFKSVFFNRLKNKFHAILITQTVEEANMERDRCSHHLAI